MIPRVGRAAKLWDRSVVVVWVPTALTAAAFSVLYRLGLVGDLPLGALLALLATASVGAETAVRRAGVNPGPVRLRILVGAQAVAVTAIIYAIGWGATLAIGYVFVLARLLEVFGSRVWRPMLVWVLVGLGAGELAVGLGVVTSYLDQPYGHGLAALSGLGIAFVVQLLGTKTAEQERSAADIRRLFADNPQPMWVYDEETLQFLEVNEAAVVAYGYSRDEFLERHITDIRPDEDVPRLLAELRSPRHPLQVSNAWRHQLRDGRIIDVEVSSHELSFEDRDAVLVAAQDVTERNHLEAALRHQAFHDALTGLANRALFADRVEHAIQRIQRSDNHAAVLLLDLDGFKTVNDSLGHTVGDQLLVAVADRLQSTLRQGDTAARLGGDEFAVLIEDLEHRDAAEEAAQRLIAVLHEPFGLAGKEIFVHASVGISFAGGDSATGDEVLRNADAAMYRAKSDGRDCYRLFEPAMHSAATERLELENDLRRAIAANEFVVHYQPVVSLGDGSIIGVEALVRWKHPTRGLLPPDDFIAIAEENGLVVEIGRWVLRESCRQARAWSLAEPQRRLTVAVNVSARQLTDPNLVGDVVDILTETGIDPETLILEITESVLIDNAAAAIARLHQLKAIGIRLAIDDFGTGYSSLSSLQQLPVDTLKIDKPFIDAVTTTSEGAGVVHAILRLARTLNLDTVAEGVEHQDQADRLAELGCSQVQGYHFAHPMPAAQLDALLGFSTTRRAESPARRA